MSELHFTLYHYPLTRSARVKWLLHEIYGDAFDAHVTVKRVALMQGEQYAPDFLERNPNHAVPLLEVTEGDTHYSLFESGAMLTLLADAFSDRGLAPPPTMSAERADYLMMLHFACSWVDMMLWHLRLHRDILPRKERDPATEARYLDKFAKEVEPQLIERIDRDGFISGSAFSAADCAMGHNVTWARAYGLCTDPAFSAYLAGLRERPAFQAAFADRADFENT